MDKKLSDFLDQRRLAIKLWRVFCDELELANIKKDKIQKTIDLLNKKRRDIEDQIQNRMRMTGHTKADIKKYLEACNRYL